MSVLLVGYPALPYSVPSPTRFSLEISELPQSGILCSAITFYNLNAAAANWIDAGFNTPHRVNLLFHLVIPFQSCQVKEAQMLIRPCSPFTHKKTHFGQERGKYRHLYIALGRSDGRVSWEVPAMSSVRKTYGCTQATSLIRKHKSDELAAKV